MKRRKLLKPKLIFYLVVALLLIVLGAIVANRCSSKNEKQGEALTVKKEEIKRMVRLTSMHLVRETELKAEVENTNIFAIGTYNIYIDFDIEEMPMTVVGDTLYTSLPVEKVRILEVPGEGFKVIDMWGKNFMGRLMGPKLSATDENKLRTQMMIKLQRKIYNDGTIRRARSEAMDRLTELLSLAPGTVIITDPTPDGDPHMVTMESYLK